VLLLAGSAANLLGGSFQTAGGWTTTTLADTTSFGTSLTLDTKGRGVGVYTSTTGGTVSSTVWSSGTWGTPAPITAAAVAMNQPSIDATGGTTSHLVYQDASFKYWYLAFTGTWSSPAAVGPAGNQSYGPVAAAIAARGADATVGFTDGQTGAMVNYAAQMDLTGGAFQAKADLAGPESFTVPPAIVPLSSGPELMMVVIGQDTKINFLTRTAGVWSSPAYINNCLTADRVALAPLPPGDAILAFRGTDGFLYWTVYSGGSWSAVAPFSTPNVSITRPPAVTHGIGGYVAEIAFIESDGMAYHARLTNGTWTTPVMVGGSSLNGVAIASAP